MKMVRIKERLSAVVGGTLIAFFIMGGSARALAQSETAKAFHEIEKTQSRIEELYIDVYDIMEKYPDTNFKYVYHENAPTEIIVNSIPDEKAKADLKGYLTELDGLKKEIYNLTNRMGIYYVTETDPQPKGGFKAFYQKLQNNLEYPDEARRNGVKGIVYVKFVVERDGSIKHVIADENIKTDYTWLLDDIEQAAEKALLATSGDWEPAMVGRVPVPKLVVLPVQFKLENTLFLPYYY